MASLSAVPLARTTLREFYGGGVGNIVAAQPLAAERTAVASL